MKISMEVGVIVFNWYHKMINGSKLLIFSTGSCDFGHEDFFQTMGPHGTLGPGALGPGLLGPQGLWDPGTLGPWDTGTLGHWDPGTLGPGLLGPQGPWDLASWDPRDPGRRGHRAPDRNPPECSCQFIDIDKFF